MKLPKSSFNIKDSRLLAYLPDLKQEKARKISNIVLSLVAFSFFGLFAINPTLSTIAKLKKELSDSKFVDQKLQGKISNLYTLQQKYNNLKSDIPIVLEAVPQTPQIPTLVGQIQALSSESNILLANIQSFQVEAGNASEIKKDFYAFSFTVSGEGKYEDVVSFLSAMTNIRRVISLDNLSINKKSDSSDLDFNVKATAYFKN